MSDPACASQTRPKGRLAGVAHASCPRVGIGAARRHGCPETRVLCAAICSGELSVVIWIQIEAPGATSATRFNVRHPGDHVGCIDGDDAPVNMMQNPAARLKASRQGRRWRGLDPRLWILMPRLLPERQRLHARQYSRFGQCQRSRLSAGYWRRSKRDSRSAS